MGKDNRNRWEPRRRGFDESTSRQEYAEPDFFQRQAATSPVVDAEVKWFNADKGFGFVKLADGTDAFLHIRALENAGHTEIGDGTRLKVRVEQGQKGKQVSEVVEVGEAVARPGSLDRSDRTSFRAGSEEREATGTVKWYDAVKGFGFISVEGISKDVFVHISALNRSGLDGLEEGEAVRVRYSQGQKGPEARSISRK